jgi:hypothetical protein
MRLSEAAAGEHAQAPAQGVRQVDNLLCISCASRWLAARWMPLSAWWSRCSVALALQTAHGVFGYAM